MGVSSPFYGWKKLSRMVTDEAGGVRGRFYPHLTSSGSRGDGCTPPPARNRPRTPLGESRQPQCRCLRPDAVERGGGGTSTGQCLRGPAREADCPQVGPARDRGPGAEPLSFLPWAPGVRAVHTPCYEKE